MKPTLVVHGGAGSGKYRANDARFKILTDAVSIGYAAMSSGGAVEGVETAVRHMESSGMLNAGRGACLNALGRLSLDAAVMEGKGGKGCGVGAVDCTYHPVSLAKWLAFNSPHVLIVGPECARYADSARIEREELIPTKGVVVKYRKLQNSMAGISGRIGMAWRSIQEGNTVGAVAVDGDGLTSAAVSTGGVWLKFPGRVGDSAIIGAGIFADRNGAACATGVGEEIIKCGMSGKACDLMAASDAKTAARKAVSIITKRGGRDTAGIITVDSTGRVGIARNTKAMGWALKSGPKDRVRIGI